MPVSERCTGRNLLNHCLQVGRPAKLEYSYHLLKDVEEIDNDELDPYTWVVKFTIDDSVHYAYGSKQLDALNKVLQDVEPILRQKL